MKLSRAFAPAALLLLSTIPALSQSPDSGKPRLEMVFVLDTTGSMSGLIDAAKQKIWSIVNDVLKSPNKPQVKVGLVAYRDHGDDYVTKVTPLTSDLDSVYTTLMAYQAGGGGDTPEDVRQALSDGVHKAGWSQREPHLAQVVFLVGDAPPHDDYVQEPSTLATTAQAVQNGLIVNTIECGPAEDTRIAWQAIARHGEGQFFAIAENGGVQAIATPYDESLVDLGNQLGRTYTAYGGSGFAGGALAYQTSNAHRQATAESTIVAAVPKPAAADRALNKAINTEAYDGDLMQSLENGSVQLDRLKKDDLPVDMQKMTPAARKALIEKRLAERKGMRAQILAISRKRDAYLASAQAKRNGGKQTGFDAAVAAALKKELAPRGIKL